MAIRRVAGTSGPRSLAIAVLALLVLPGSAEAAFPGQNGKIAFHSVRNANLDIYSIDPDGSGEARLTSDPAAEREPAWSPDGTRIAYQSFRTHHLGEIYVMNADGSNQVRLTDNIATGSNGDRYPSWSPDGAKIVFARMLCAPVCSNDLFTMNADGTAQTALTSSPASSENSPVWAPDNSQIAFMGGGGSIFLMNPDGSGVARLPDGTPGIGADTDPNWSPDSQRIAYTHDRCENACDPDFPMDLRLVDRAGATDVKVVEDAHHPAWSPDGAKLAFDRATSTRSPPTGAG